MRLSFSQIESIKQKSGKSCVAAQVRPFGIRFEARQRGFTLVELVMTIVIIGVLAAVVAPRFFSASAFQSQGFADQAQSSLRYAQKAAIAQRRNVCVVTTATQITLTIASATGVASACDTDLEFPQGGNTIDVPAGVTLAVAAVNFDGLGRSAGATISVSGAAGIVVEAETGYVHSL